jgi:hypothetical protein
VEEAFHAGAQNSQTSQTDLTKRLARHRFRADQYRWVGGENYAAISIRFPSGSTTTLSYYPSPVRRGPSSIGNPPFRSVWVSQSTIASEPTKMAG